jgi:anti-sigma regulatory factor (Ser/Thr protein kinase)
LNETLTDRTFRHEALLYAGEAEFVDRVSAFIRDGVAAGEPTLVCVSAPKLEKLRCALEGDPRGVWFADMAHVGRNPARIIPAWQKFIDKQGDPGRPMRGVGEPIWVGRTPEQLVECQRHESLLNLAFDGVPAWWLVCPYDTASLPASVLDEARRSHPFVFDGHDHSASSTYRPPSEVAGPFDAPLCPAPSFTHRMTVSLSELAELRRFVARRARALGMSADRSSDLVAATNEVATNSLLYGGGRCVVRLWSVDDELVCEVRDTGHIEEPMVGCVQPKPRVGGLGLWLCNQLCDLVQIRTFEDGSVVRLHMSRKR